MATKKFAGKQWLMTALKVGVAAAVLSWLIFSGKFDPSSLKKIGRLEIWVFGIGLFLGSLAINTKRWCQLLSFKAVHLKFFDGLRFSLIGIFFNFVIPGGVGGDVVKAGYLFRQYPEKKAFCGWTTFVDRVLGLSSLLVYAGLSGIFFHDRLGPEAGPSIQGLSLFILSGGAGAFLLLAFGPVERIQSFLQSRGGVFKLLAVLFEYFSQPRRIVGPIALSFCGQLLMISIFALLGMMLGETFPWYIYFILVPLGTITTILPIAPAGLGVGQAAFFFLFETAVQNGEFGILAITFVQAVQFLVGLLGGILFILYDKKTERPDHG